MHSKTRDRLRMAAWGTVAGLTVGLPTGFAVGTQADPNDSTPQSDQTPEPPTDTIFSVFDARGCQSADQMAPGVNIPLPTGTVVPHAVTGILPVGNLEQRNGLLDEFLAVGGVIQDLPVSPDLHVHAPTPVYKTPEEAFRHADVIVTGRTVSMEVDRDGLGIKTVFQPNIETTGKNSTGEAITFYQPSQVITDATGTQLLWQPDFFAGVIGNRQTTTVLLQQYTDPVKGAIYIVQPATGVYFIEDGGYVPNCESVFYDSETLGAFENRPLDEFIAHLDGAESSATLELPGN